MPRAPRGSPFSLPVFRPEMLPADAVCAFEPRSKRPCRNRGMSWIESRSNALMIACLPTSRVEGAAYETHLNVWWRIAFFRDAELPDQVYYSSLTVFITNPC